MKLTSFSVTNFRSITKAHNISIHGTTVLVGKNNEGKSNLLKALSVAMSIIANYPRLHRLASMRVPYRLHQRRGADDMYAWDRDYPVSLQNQKSPRPTMFRLHFSLSDEEVSDFRNEIKSNLDGSLPLAITIGKEETPTIRVVKGGES